MTDGRNVDRVDKVTDTGTTSTDDPLAKARADNSPGAFNVKTDTGNYQLHEMHLSGVGSLPGMGADSKVNPYGEMTQTASRQDGDNTVTTFQGKLHDNIIPLIGSKTNVTLVETTGADGTVSKLKVHYDSGQDLVIAGIAAAGGGGMIAKDIKDVTITPRPDGSCMMKFDRQGGGLFGSAFDTVLLGTDGKVIVSFDSHNPADVYNAQDMYRVDISG